MADNETITDIIAEMREIADNPECVAPTGLRHMADRLEAAWKREKAAIEADALAAGGLVEASRATAEKSSAVGNMAAMREALEMMNTLFEQGAICTSSANSAEEMEQIEELYSKTKAALAEPPRNCDVGTVGEQEARFFAFCKNHDCTVNCPVKKKWDFKRGHNPSCGVLFSQMPYEEGGAK